MTKLTAKEETQSLSLELNEYLDDAKPFRALMPNRMMELRDEKYVAVLKRMMVL